MKIYVVTDLEGKFLTAHRQMSDFAYQYNINPSTVRVQFLRKGYYNKGNIKVLRVEI